jgi:serine/threonine protein kinase
MTAYGRYRIVKELGRGTMGVVYQAHDPQIDRMVALKVLRPDRVTSEDFVARFLKEARAIGRLSHPGIVTIFDVGSANDTIYIAMEFLQGQPLNEAIRGGRLSAAQSIQIAIQVAEALDYAHDKGIIHRDIKPSNIILNPENQMKLTDFGIARIEDVSASHQTREGEILGTPIYMAPEQVTGQSVDRRSDLYSLGVVLYEMVAGRRPFRGNNIAAIFRAITMDDPEPIDSHDRQVCQPVCDLITKSLSKNPQARFQTGQQMAEALRSAADSPLPDQTGAARKPGRSKRLYWMAGLAVLLVAVAVAAVRYYQDQRSVAPTQPVAAPAERYTVKYPAVLKVSSEPAGAQVYIDSVFKGLAPLDIPLALGKYELRLNLPDHLGWEAQVELDTEGDIPVHVQLQPIN